jgi:hypothetical protein
MNTQENNKLIAEFMSVDYVDVDTYLEDNKELQYHTSWDWLMPVVERIESFIFDENNSYNVTIGSTNYCIIQDSNGDRIEIIKDNGETKLETVYKAVVEFIKQYIEECSKLEGDFMCINCGGGFTRDEIVTDEDGDDFCNSCK